MNKLVQPHSFGACLMELRRRRNLPQKALAILADMDQSYISGLEAERRPPPKEKQLLRILQALQATQEEEQELREAHLFSRLVDVAADIDPANGKTLIAVASYFERLCREVQKTA